MVSFWRSQPTPTNLPSKCQSIYLNQRPTGEITDETFGQREETLPNIKDFPKDSALIRVLYVSCDPAMRGWLSNQRSYISPVEIGATMRAAGVGEVIYSTGKFRIGDLVEGMFGWKDYCIIASCKLIEVKLNKNMKPSIILGVLGITGLTAYFGLLNVGKPKKGDTVVVSAAAGATGSIVCQIAKHIMECDVIGIAGGDEKCDYLRNELGIKAVDYKSEENINEGLRRELKGKEIDIYFDNVGGNILEAALRYLNLNARVVICGAISQYNSLQKTKGPSNYMNLLVKRASMTGFLLQDYEKDFSIARNQLSRWIKQGKIKYKEYEIEGLYNAPLGLKALFTGKNIGKVVIKVNDTKKADENRISKL